MLDLRLLREKKEWFESRFLVKNKKIDLSAILSLDEKRRELIAKGDRLRAQQKAANDGISKAQGAEKAAAVAAMKSVSDQIKVIEAEMREVETALNDALLTLPNPPHESVPAGKDDSENVPISTWGTPRKFDFEPKDHIELGETLDIIDTERGAKVSGARFYFLKGNGVLLHRAIHEMVLQTIISHGFTPMLPPVLVKRENLVYTGMFPGDEGETFRCEEDEKYLIGTSEIPGVGYHAGEILPLEKGKPMKYVLFSPCFRREAGSYGKDTKGILRVHQFDKTEMVIFAHPDDSWAIHEELRQIEEEIAQKLELPYQVLNICGGDLGAPAAKKYDIEAWFPTQGKYREITSTSNCTDFQARRANIRFRNEEGKTEIAHTLNGTGASTRPLIAILENHQQADGSVTIPKALQPYLGGKEKLLPRNS